ncbi:MAG: winged helix-turn-helix domain-containing protein [Gemmatimonadaceae bacterium]|nr:winged helix-turn-helix domain-containing protein [Gemmatimonadaceae bacterium]
MPRSSSSSADSRRPVIASASEEASHISELRQKLENRPDDPKHIVTVWKAGYRFDR